MSEMIPSNQTGFGPTGSGHNPSRRESAEAARRRASSERVGDIMPYIDPDVVRAVDRAVQIGGRTNDPAEMRRRSYNTKGGQGARDLAMGLRVAGAVGSGNPYDFAHNIHSGMTSGGFSADISGQVGGRNVRGMNQRVTGSGILTEQMSKSFVASLQDELYGRGGSTDPSKMNGFDVSEVSGVAKTIMQRGGVGKMGSIIHGADTQTRLDAATQGTYNQGLKEKLSKVRAGSDDELQTIIDNTNDDPELKKQLQNVKQSTAAVFGNKNGAKDVSKLVKEVTKGMASLTDVYEELSAPAAQAMLESVVGKNITDRSTAKKANMMVNSMKSTAMANGWDTGAYIDYSQRRQANFQDLIGEKTGIDDRSAGRKAATSANISDKIRKRAAAESAQSKEVEADAKRKGIKGLEGSAKSIDEVSLDMEQQTGNYMERFQGATLLSGNIDMIANPELKKAIQEKMARFNATDDADEKEDLETEFQNIAGKEFGGGSWNAAKNDQARMSRAVERAWEDDAFFEGSSKFSKGGLQNSNIASSLSYAYGKDEASSKVFAKKLTNELGAGGMMDIRDVAKGPDKDAAGNAITADDRKKQMMDNLQRYGGMDEDSANDAISTFTDAEGRLKDEKSFDTIMSSVAVGNYGGGSTYSRNKAAEKRMNSAVDDKGRGDAGDGKSILKNIATALVRGEMTATDPDTIAKTMGAMKDMGYESMIVGEVDEDGKPTGAGDFDMMKEFATGIDVSKGLNADNLKQITDGSGQADLKLAERSGFKSNEEMFKATQKSPAALEKVIDTLKMGAPDQNFDVTGDGSLSVITDRAAAAASHTKGGVMDRVNDMAGAMSLNPNLSDGEVDTLSESAASGKLNFGKYEADKYKGDVESKWFSKDKRKFAHMDGNRRMLDLASTYSESKGTQREQLNGLNRDGGVTRELENQISELRKAKADGADTIISKVFDAKSGKEVEKTDNVDSAIAKLEATLKEWGTAEKSGTVGNMTVELMTVVRKDEDTKK